MPAGTPTQIVDRFLTAEKAFECATAFAYLSDGLRTTAGSVAATCAVLHKNPIVSFMPSTLIHQGGPTALVQVQVTCQSGGAYDIATVVIVPIPSISVFQNSGGADARSLTLNGCYAF